MNITYDKSSIYVADMPKVKEDMKHIKKIYTDGDFARYAYDAFSAIYEEITGELFPYCSDIIRMNVTAYAHDYQGTHFRVEVLNDWCDCIQKVTFYATWHGEDEGMTFDNKKHWNEFKRRYEYTFNVRKYNLEGRLCEILSEDGMRDVV